MPSETCNRADARAGAVCVTVLCASGTRVHDTARYVASSIADAAHLLRDIDRDLVDAGYRSSSHTYDSDSKSARRTWEYWRRCPGCISVPETRIVVEITLAS